jgi:hypothetical protein
MSYAYDAFTNARAAGTAIPAAFAAYRDEASIETFARAMNDNVDEAAALIASLQATSDHYATQPRTDAQPCPHEETVNLEPYSYDLADFKQCVDCDEYLDSDGETTWDPRPGSTMGRHEFRSMVA